MTGENDNIEKNSYNTEGQNKRKTSYWLLIIFIILLLIFNAFLLYQFIHQKSQKQVYYEELVSTTDLKEELEKELQDYELKVEEYEDIIDQKDSTLMAYQSEIEMKVSEIKRLIQKDNISRRKYKEAERELKTLRYYTKKYQKQINELKRQNKILTEENTGLKANIKDKKKEIDKLTDENVSLSNKVSLGAKLVSDQILVSGIQIRNSGKKKETMKGSRMTAIKISFTLNNNIIAKRGPREFIVKILTPRGETLYIENSGSGKFEYLGEESLYTVKEELEFNNDPSKIYTIYWSKGSPFEKGSYKAELFSDGQMIGKKSFILK